VIQTIDDYLAGTGYATVYYFKYILIGY